MNATPILSIVFNNYKNLNNEQNNNNNQNIKRVKILNDLNVNNNDIFSKKLLDKLEELKNKTIKRFESSIILNYVMKNLKQKYLIMLFKKRLKYLK